MKSTDWAEGYKDGFYNHYSPRNRWGYCLSDYNKGFCEGLKSRQKLLLINSYAFL